MWHPSSLTRAQTQVPSIGRCTLNHWTTREVPEIEYYGYVWLYKIFIFFNVVIRLFKVTHGSQLVSPRQLSSG